jgi:sigma-E factor negative regulatory protein RseB
MCASSILKPIPSRKAATLGMAAATRLFAAIGLMVLANGVRGNEAETLLKRVAEATSALTYDGIFIYSRDDHIDAMRVVHTRKDGTELERLIALSGPPMEVVRDGARVTCTFPDDKAVMVERRTPLDYVGLQLSQPIEQIGRYYEFDVTGSERVAGRVTRKVTVSPRFADRYSLKLWIDQETNLLLKSAVIGRNGQVLEQVMFTQLTVGAPLADDALRAELNGVGYTWHTDSQASATASAPRLGEFTIGWLPNGFEMKNQHTQRLSSSEIPVMHMVYSDGLAMVSIFVEALSGDSPPLQGYTAMGAVNAFSRIAKPYQITVVGDVPQTTVRQIAASVGVKPSK